MVAGILCLSAYLLFQQSIQNLPFIQVDFFFCLWKLKTLMVFYTHNWLAQINREGFLMLPNLLRFVYSNHVNNELWKYMVKCTINWLTFWLYSSFEFEVSAILSIGRSWGWAGFVLMNLDSTHEHRPSEHLKLTESTNFFIITSLEHDWNTKDIVSTYNENIMLTYCCLKVKGNQWRKYKYT